MAFLSMKVYWLMVHILILLTIHYFQPYFMVLFVFVDKIVCYTVKPEIFTTVLFSRLSRIRKIREIKKSEKFYLFSYLRVKFGVCRAIMGVNITT